MNKKILISLSIIGVVTAIAIGGTIAYFSDTETSIGNTFTAGDFDLLIDSTCKYNGQIQSFCTWLEKDLDGDLFFNFGDVKPGDSGEDTVSFHIIDNPAWLCAEVANLVNQDNGCRKPEQKVDETCGTPGIGEGELQNNLFFTVWRDFDCDNQYNGDDYYVVQNQTAQAGIWPIADSTTGGGPIPADSTICYALSWNVPLMATTNVIQSDSLVGNIIFTAVQSRHMADYVCGQGDGEGEEEAFCGNGIVEGGEECDDGNQNNNDACKNDCTVAVCGDGVVYGGVEECDDGNNTPGDGCSASCEIEAEGICGDGILDPGEQCDDANAQNNDGCDSTCVVECGWNCSGEPSACIQITEVCNDNIDNDCDGATDCDDSDCTSDPFCTFTPECTTNDDCDDQNVCTTDTCVSGECEHTNNTNSCDDGDACTDNDACSGGTCGGQAITCDDGNMCTIDACDPATGCTHNNVDPGSSCINLGCFLFFGSCLNGQCVCSITPLCNSDADCDDGNACTTDDCYMGLECRHTDINCDDGDNCTLDYCDMNSGCWYLPNPFPPGCGGLF